MKRLFQVTGPNGSGKTSALRFLGTSPQAASLLFPLPALADFHVRSTAIGFQAGQNVIFSRSVKSLLTTPLVFAGVSGGDATRRVTDLLNRFGFAYLLQRDYLTLSGGERQFVALFSCLLSDVDLYLLDDPVVMMDNERAAKILQVIAECVEAKGQTAYGVTSVRPEYYANLKGRDIVHLGYSPQTAACLRQFDSVLASLPRFHQRQMVISIQKMTMAPYGRILLREARQEWHSGETVLLTGGNGTGKTCLLQTVAGILKPSSGSVSMETYGHPAERPEIGRNCFYLPQQFTSLLGFDTLAQELQITAAVAWWREILNFIFDWRIVNPELRVPESSLGERHFCNILAAISALARNAGTAALLLDEPDSGLDELRCQLLTRLLAWLAAQDYFIGVVSHHPLVFAGSGAIPLKLRECTIDQQQLVVREPVCG